MIFDQIYWDIIRFKEQNIDEVILAVDSPDTWRKVFFSRYKEKRKDQRSTDVDWDVLFAEFQELQDKIRQYIPFKVLKVRRCEADDIIGALCHKLPEKNFIVVSNDVDYKQLCSLPNTEVFEPKSKKFVECNDTEEFLTKLCLTGQSKDGIFNAKTPDDYPAELRNPPLGEKTAEKILEEGLSKFLDTPIEIKKECEDGEYQVKFTPRKLFSRNKILLDFRRIPEVLTRTIVKCYNEYQMPDYNNMYKFFDEYGWTSYIESFDITERVLAKLK